MKKGIVFLIVFLMVISFPICGYAKGKEKICLDSSWKYADHARITSGYAVYTWQSGSNFYMQSILGHAYKCPESLHNICPKITAE